MIVDSINNSKKYMSIHKDFERVFQYLKSMEEASVGKVVLDEGNVWINVMDIQDTPKGTRSFEAHREFIDVHYIYCGEEEFGYSNIDRLQTTVEYNPQNDCELLEGVVNTLCLNAGDFVVTFPEDAHMPYITKGDGQLIHIVAKIRL